MSVPDPLIQAEEALRPFVNLWEDINTNAPVDELPEESAIDAGMPTVAQLKACASAMTELGSAKRRELRLKRLVLLLVVAVGIMVVKVFLSMS